MPVKNIDMILGANVVPFVWTEGQPVGLWLSYYARCAEVQILQPAPIGESLNMPRLAAGIQQESFSHMAAGKTARFPVSGQR